MRLLAMDTATEVCGVATHVDGRLIAQRVVHQGLTHTKVLMPIIDSVLQQSGLDLNDLDALVVTKGPGSFTGLRIGISTAKGLSIATGKPLVGISTLAVLAHQAPVGTEWVCPMIDARRNEVYWALYQRKGNLLKQVIADSAGPLNDLLRAIKRPCLFVGNGAKQYADAIAEQSLHPVHMASMQAHTIAPGVLAGLGQKRMEQGFAETLDSLTPVYLRKSDAELGRKKA